MSYTDNMWPSGRMKLNTCILFYVVYITSITKVSGSQRDKRYVIWPVGGSYIQVIMGIGLPIKLHPEDVVMGIVTKFFYNLPDNATVVTNPLLTFAASGRQYVGSLNRWQLYAMAEAVVSGLGANGRPCLLRAICEAAETQIHQDSLLGEMGHLLLTPSSTYEEGASHDAEPYLRAERMGGSEEGCRDYYRECDVSLIDYISSMTG